MSFNFYLIRGIRLLLFPFSLVVGLYINLRNYLYNKQWLKSTDFNIPTICIGNLSVGGTGKSPMTEYLLRILSNYYKVGVISRGYKRKTKGYVLADEKTTALEIGDEPMQFYTKFPQVAIAVGEERVEAIPQLLQDRPEVNVIIFDDAFQHRKIQAGFNIILTDFSNPYWQDWFLPTGDLRDETGSAQRAQMIIVTKCPAQLGLDVRQQYVKAINPLAGQKIFFTTIIYGKPYHIKNGDTIDLHADLEVLLVCGIANPLPLKKHLEMYTSTYFEKNYEDHHIFSIDNWNEISEKFNKMEATQKIILTTEKDAVRLMKFNDLLSTYPLYVLPIRHSFLFEEAPQFEQSILHFIEQNKSIPS